MVFHGLQERLRIAHEVASALEYMHSTQPPLAHLNVKPANILLSRQMQAKVTAIVQLSMLMAASLVELVLSALMAVEPLWRSHV